MQTLASTSANVATLPRIQDSVATSRRRNKIIYWILTLVMFVPATAGAFVEAFTQGPASIVKIMIALGYLLYLMKILGGAKIFGGLEILTGKLPRMKEWAYAGFAFDFLCNGVAPRYGRCGVCTLPVRVLPGSIGVVHLVV